MLYGDDRRLFPVVSGVPFDLKYRKFFFESCDDAIYMLFPVMSMYKTPNATE